MLYISLFFCSEIGYCYVPLTCSDAASWASGLEGCAITGGWVWGSELEVAFPGPQWDGVRQWRRPWSSVDCRWARVSGVLLHISSLEIHCSSFDFSFCMYMVYAMHVFVYACLCMCMYVEIRYRRWVSSSLTFCLFGWHGSLDEPGAHCFGFSG